MTAKEFVDKYWKEAIQAENRTKVPAIYILGHAIIATEVGKKIGTLDKVTEEVVELSWFQKFLNLFKKKEVLKEGGEVDFVKDFLANINYPKELEYIQNLNEFIKAIEIEDERHPHYNANITLVHELVKEIHQ